MASMVQGGGMQMPMGMPMGQDMLAKEAMMGGGPGMKQMQEQMMKQMQAAASGADTTTIKADLVKQMQVLASAVGDTPVGQMIHQQFNAIQSNPMLLQANIMGAQMMVQQFTMMCNGDSKMMQENFSKQAAAMLGSSPELQEASDTIMRQLQLLLNGVGIARPPPGLMAMHDVPKGAEGMGDGGPVGPENLQRAAAFQKIMRKKKRENQTTVFIGGLRKTTEEDRVHAHFAKYGEVEHVDIKRTPDGTSRGFAFVRFKDEESVERVIEAHAKHMIDNKWVEVRRRDSVAACAGRAATLAKEAEEEKPPPAAPPAPVPAEGKDSKAAAEDWSQQYLTAAQQMGMVQQAQSDMMKAMQAQQRDGKGMMMGMGMPGMMMMMPAGAMMQGGMMMAPNGMMPNGMMAAPGGMVMMGNMDPNATKAMGMDPSSMMALPNGAAPQQGAQDRAPSASSSSRSASSASRSRSRSPADRRSRSRDRREAEFASGAGDGKAHMPAAAEHTAPTLNPGMQQSLPTPPLPPGPVQTQVGGPGGFAVPGMAKFTLRPAFGDPASDPNNKKRAEAAAAAAAVASLASRHAEAARIAAKEAAERAASAPPPPANISAESGGGERQDQAHMQHEFLQGTPGAAATTERRGLKLWLPEAATAPAQPKARSPSRKRRSPSRKASPPRRRHRSGGWDKETAPAGSNVTPALPSRPAVPPGGNPYGSQPQPGIVTYGVKSSGDRHTVATPETLHAAILRAQQVEAEGRRIMRDTGVIPRGPPDLPTGTEVIEQKYVAYLIGKGGQALAAINSAAGVHIHIDQSTKASGYCMANIYGNEEGTMKAKCILAQKISEYRPPRSF